MCSPVKPIQFAGVGIAGRQQQQTVFIAAGIKEFDSRRTGQRLGQGRTQPGERGIKEFDLSPFGRIRCADHAPLATDGDNLIDIDILAAKHKGFGGTAIELDTEQRTVAIGSRFKAINDIHSRIDCYRIETFLVDAIALIDRCQTFPGTIVGLAIEITDYARLIAGVRAFPHAFDPDMAQAVGDIFIDIQQRILDCRAPQRRHVNRFNAQTLVRLADQRTGADFGDEFASHQHLPRVRSVPVDHPATVPVERQAFFRHFWRDHRQVVPIGINRDHPAIGNQRSGIFAIDHQPTKQSCRGRPPAPGNPFRCARTGQNRARLPPGLQIGDHDFLPVAIGLDQGQSLSIG